MSATAVRGEYAALLATALPSVIRSEAENERCIRALEELDRKGTRMSAAERRLADLLTLLIENFEQTQYALEPADPVTIIEELMSANGLKQKDLLDIFGSSSIVSEVLNGKRRLTTEHIRKLSRRFHVSADVFI
ncbi:MAG: hypothetical protein WCB53_22615 [Terriglobales bacterium]